MPRPSRCSPGRLNYGARRVLSRDLTDEELAAVRALYEARGSKRHPPFKRPPGAEALRQSPASSSILMRR